MGSIVLQKDDSQGGAICCSGVRRVKRQSMARGHDDISDTSKAMLLLADAAEQEQRMSLKTRQEGCHTGR